MRIGVEASRANRLQRTGVEWYACHLMRELAKLPQAQAHEWLAYTDRPFRADLRASIPMWKERILPWPLPYLWTQIALSREMQQFPPDVLFLPAHVLPRILPKKTVVTVHDVGFRRFPQLYKKIQIAYHEITTRDIVRSNAKIITVSAFSKRELIDLYHASPDQVAVTPLGIDVERYRPQSLEKQEQVRKTYGLERPYILFVGRLEEKKNIERLVKAFCSVAATLPGEPELVLVGPEGRGWPQVARWLTSHPMRARVRVLGYLPEEDKPALLSAAAWSIQPSLYEGFGLPVLEAMACGTPVLCSDIGSLREVVGSARARFFDPTSVEEITTAIDRALRLSADECADLVRLGLSHAQTYTWKRTAEATFPLLVS